MADTNPTPSAFGAFLDRLTIGASKSYYTVEAWAEHFAGVPFSTTFITQLRREWYDATPPDAACEVILEACKAHLSQWHTGWPNLWAHTLRVIGNALYLAPAAGVEAAPAFALAALHDVGKFDEMREGEEHELIASSLAREILTPLFDKGTTSMVAAAVGKRARSSSPYTQLLHDADKLEKIGASGIVRRVSQVLNRQNALSALARIEADLTTFPEMKLRTAQPLADNKRNFTLQVLSLAAQYQKSIIPEDVAAPNENMQNQA